MNIGRRKFFLAFALVGMLFVDCGLAIAEWRTKLEPLLPAGVTIVHSKTGNCTIQPNCSVRFVLEHDRTRYAEDVAAFEAAMEAKGWERTAGVVQEGSALAVFHRPGIRVSLPLLSPSWRERCVASRGHDAADCQSTLVVKLR